MLILSLKQLVRASLAVAVTLIALTRPGVVRAEETAKPASSDQVGYVRPTEFAVGPRFLLWKAPSPDLPAGGFGYGLDGSYLLDPHFGVGAELLSYSEVPGREHHPLELSEGWSALAYGEGRLPLTSFLAPYARGGAGYSHLTLNADEPPYQPQKRDAFAFMAEAGIELHYVVSVRFFGMTLLHPTVGEAPAVFAFGGQFGFRF